MGLLGALLQDRSTRKNIMWATDAYLEQGTAYGRSEEIFPELITGEHIGLIKTRARKAFEQQNARTKQRAEVFTPNWIVKKMNDHADEVWFSRSEGFHRLDENGHVAFKSSRTWKHYVENRRMELTCGEGPYLATRYDAASGEIIPLAERSGLLDRKLRAVNENAADFEEWLAWAYKALQATYGYEFQGDSLLIARVNVLVTFEENMEERWERRPTRAQYRRAIQIITWNLWQMDGLTDRIPCSEAAEQISLFDTGGQEPRPWCRVYNWRQQRSVQFRSLKGARTRMRFDYIIGNPPYQDETLGENKGFAPPIYHLFMDEAYAVADKVELIHPARFLFNAGSTPKAWNRKMLNDEHFQVLLYEADADNLFTGVEIKGGVVVSYHDKNKNFGAIKVFLRMQELNDILKKVTSKQSFAGLDEITVSRTVYRLTDKFHEDHPEARYKEDAEGNNIGCLSKGHDNDMATNIFDRIPQVFFNECPNDGYEYIQILGREGNDRVFKWIRRDYVNDPKPLFKWSIVLPKANNTGQFGEVLSQPVVTAPKVGSTETFLSVGFFETEIESRNCLKYISTKFARAMLGILKTTQDLTPDKFKYVPVQDFTANSDINWSVPIKAIDRQLYAKYGLDETEIAFIESHVKEMA